MDKATEDRRRELTRRSLIRIAEAKIKAFNLSDTPEEYIEKCVARTTREMKTLHNAGSPYTTVWRNK